MIYYKYGYKFVAPSIVKDKKYDVYDIRTDKKLASFGNRNYEQYKDKISFYKHLDHGNNKKRLLYKMRHPAAERHKYQSPSWFADRFLW